MAGIIKNTTEINQVAAEVDSVIEDEAISQAVAALESKMDIQNTSISALGLLLSDPELKIRQEAVCSLGKIGDKGVIPLLIKALQDNSPGVRWRAVMYIGQIADADILPILKEHLENEENKEVQEHLKKAIDRIGSLKPSVIIGVRNG